MRVNGLHPVASILVVAGLAAGAVACGVTPASRDRNDAGAQADTGDPDASGAGCVLVAEPAEVDIGRVPDGETSCVDVVVSNTGAGACSIIDYFIVSAGGEFAIEDFESAYPEGLTLAPSGSTSGLTEIAIDVCFAAQGTELARGGLQVMALSTSTLLVPLSANDGVACIEVAPTLEFGAVRVGFEAVEELAITHCGDVDAPDFAPLVVSDIRWANADADTVFELLPQSLPLELAPGESATVAVRYRPGDIGVDSAQTLEIATNDEVRPVAEVEVSGRAADPACPTAVPLCTIYRGTEAPSNQIFAAPADYVLCDAGASEDLDGEIVEYRWEVLSKPLESRARFDTPDSQMPGVFLDVPGGYELQLTTVDDDGCESPRPGRVSVVAASDQGVQIVLVWDTPGDRDQTDSSGADLDLHLLHPSGCWEDSVWDVHFRNTNPNWGDRQREDDNPMLERDSAGDTDPEVIIFDNPEDGIIYRVGVNHYGHGWLGPSTATLLIYIEGGFAGVFTRENLYGRQFWEVASITWPSGEIEKLDLVYDHVDEAICP